MHNLGLFWSMYAPACAAFLSQTLPQILSGPAEDAQRNGLPIQKIGDIALISVKGTMVKDSWWSFLASSKAGQKAVESARADDEIETIILWMDSPGGSVDGLAEFGDAVAMAAKTKTVIAQVEGMSASANYYIASQAHKIYSGRNDLIGSIGTRIMLMDDSKFYENHGIKMIPVDTGEFKSAGAPGVEITESQIADFQRIVDGYFNDFIAMVASGRGMDKKEVLKAADGRVFFPSEAIDLGLIDGVQSIQETLKQLKTTPTQSSHRTANAKNRLKLLTL